VVNATDPYGHILGFLHRTICILIYKKSKKAKPCPEQAVEPYILAALYSTETCFYFWY
jgi:hypothetical protein